MKRLHRVIIVCYMFSMCVSTTDSWERLEPEETKLVWMFFERNFLLFSFVLVQFLSALNFNDLTDEQEFKRWGFLQLFITILNRYVMQHI